MRKATIADNFEGLKSLYEQIALLHDEAFSEVHGREATILAQAQQGTLDANAGVNYTLLGQSLMVDAPRLATELRLRTVDEENEAGNALLRQEQEPARAHGQALLGSSLLRQGAASKARRAFEKARDLDGKNFAASLGLGAAMDAEKHDLAARVRRLPAPDPEPFDALREVVPDYAALTELERRVVEASAAPIPGWIELLQRAGATIRLLPIDVRATDLEELAAAEGERAPDHRAEQAIGGLATDGFACARVIGLLNIEAQGGWTFAHELAHLAFFELPERVQAIFAGLHEAAVEVGYVVGAYAAQNVDEFVACSYEEFLRELYACGNDDAHDDDHGLRELTFVCFEELGAIDYLSGEAAIDAFFARFAQREQS